MTDIRRGISLATAVIEAASGVEWPALDGTMEQVVGHVTRLRADRDALKAEVERLRVTDDFKGRSAQTWFEMYEQARAQLETAREALTALLRLTSTIEVLGEWEAMDVNASMRKKERAKVDACIERCRAALRDGGEP